MGRKKPAEPGKDLLLFEKVILAAVWLFGTLFMLLVIFRYVINVSPIIKYFKWYAVLLIAAVLLHLLITKLKYPQTTYRIKNYLGKMKSFEQIFVIALFIWFAVVCAVREWIDQASYFKTADWWKSLLERECGDLCDVSVAEAECFDIAWREWFDSGHEYGARDREFLDRGLDKI